MPNTGGTDGTSIASNTYTSVANVKAYLTAIGATDNALLADDITAADDWLNTELRWSFHQETRTAEQIGFPYVKIDNTGALVIRVDKCPLTAVASVAYRVSPLGDWVSVDASSIEFYPTADTHPVANSNLIRCYTSLSSLRGTPGLRVKVTYTGGFDPIPAGLEWLARRVCAWRYKQKDTASAKIAMPAMGQIIIPEALPADIAQDFKKWKRWA